MGQDGDKRVYLDQIHHLIRSSWTNISQLHELVTIMELAINPEEGISDESSKSPIYWGPSLPLFCCQAVGGQLEHALPVAAAWLLYYIAAHTYDAIVDHDIPDPWWDHLGPGPALNVATSLVFTASYVLDSLKNQPIDEETVSTIIRDFYVSLSTVCAGQHQDLITKEPSLEQWWQIANEKAGIPFSLACRSGTRIGTTNNRLIESLSRFGFHLGLMLQVSDDAFDLNRLVNVNFKPGDQLLRKSLPFVYAMEVLPEQDKRELGQFIQSSQNDISDVSRVIDLMEKSGSDLYLRTQIQHNRLMAMKSLNEVRGIGKAWNWLESLLVDIFPEISV